MAAADGGGIDTSNFPRRNGRISGPGTETSDDIPAMLSDGEFVMTAKAVRGAGNGSREAGMRNMYNMMSRFERGTRNVATETTRQIIQEAPEIEAKRLELLNAVRNFVDQNLSAVGQEAPPPVLPPAFQVAGLTPLQQQAASRAAQGVGAYPAFHRQHAGCVAKKAKITQKPMAFGGLTVDP